MKVVQRRYNVKVGAPRHGGYGDFPGFLDMMRYDRAVIISWDFDNASQVFNIVIATTDREATMDRWASFALYPKAIT